MAGKRGCAPYALEGERARRRGEEQAVLFYVYFDDVAATRSPLEKAGVAVGPIEHPSYSPGGEFRVRDPDGYVLMITHTWEEAAMPESANSALARRWFDEVWNDRRDATVDEPMHSEAVGHMEGWRSRVSRNS